MEKDRHYIQLCSEDSKERYPENEVTNFTSELPKPLYLKGQWEMALMEAVYNKDLHSPYYSMYILCDICEDNIVHNNVRPILRKMTREPFLKVPIFVNVKSEFIQRIRISMVDSKLRPLKNVSGGFSCSLLLRRKGI